MATRRRGSCCSEGADERGFAFFTNYASRKGRELAARARAALLFLWPELERQIRIEGAVSQVDAGESREYFAGAPAIVAARRAGRRRRASRSAAALSSEARFAEFADRYRDANAPGASACALGRLPARSRLDRVLAGAARRGFTIASAIAERRRIRPHGSSTGWRRERRDGPVGGAACLPRRAMPCRRDASAPLSGNAEDPR